MILVTWPFLRARPGGYVPNDVPQPDEINTMDENVAQAADGLVYSDVALLRNWNAPQELTNFGRVALWSPASRRWWTAGVSGGDPIVAWAANGVPFWTVNSPAAGAGLTAAARAFATNGAGVLMLGGTPGSSSAQKLRRAVETVYSATWTTVSTADSSSAGVTCLHYFATLARWIAGLSNGNIEASSDGTGTTWANTPLSGATGLPLAIASSATRCVLLMDDQTFVITTDLATFTQPSTSVAANWRDVAYSQHHDRFMAVGDDGLLGIPSIQVSDDGGDTWVDLLTPPIGSGGATDKLHRVVALGRLWVLYGDDGTTNTFIWVSADNGGSWQMMRKVVHGGTASAVLAAAESQVLFVDSTANGTHYLSFGGGY